MNFVPQEPRPVCLGQTAKDVVTGFTGVVVAYSQYITGCTQVALQGKVASEQSGAPACEWFDIQRLIIVEDVPTVEVSFSSTGGPQTSHPRTSGRRC